MEWSGSDSNGWGEKFRNIELKGKNKQRVWGNVRKTTNGIRHKRDSAKPNGRVGQSGDNGRYRWRHCK